MWQGTGDSLSAKIHRQQIIKVIAYLGLVGMRKSVLQREARYYVRLGILMQTIANDISKVIA